MSKTNRGAVTTAVLSGFYLCISHQPCFGDGVSYYFQRGQELYKINDYKGSAEFYSKVICLTADPGAYFNRAQCYRFLGKHKESIADFSKFIQKPSNEKDLLLKAREHRGNEYYYDGDYKKGIDDFNYLIQGDVCDQHGTSSYYNFRGRCYGALGEHQRAIADYSEAIRWHGDSAVHFGNRASEYEDLKQYDRALADLNSNVKLANYNDAFFKRAMYFQRRGEPERAVADYTTAIEKSFDKPVPGYYNNRGNAYLELGDFANAKKDYAESAKDMSAKSIWRNHANQARLFTLDGDFSSARAEIERAVIGKEKPLYAVKVLAELELAEKKFDAALKAINSVIHENNKDADLFALRAEALTELGQREKGAADIQKARELDSEIATKSANSAWGLLCGGRRELSQRCFARALMLDQHNARALLGAAVLSGTMGKYDEARAMFEKFDSTNQRPLLLSYYRGSIEELAGDHERAIAYFTRAIVQSPENQDVLHARANSYLLNNQPDKAIKDCDKALSLNSKDRVALLIRATAAANQRDFEGSSRDLSRIVEADNKKNDSRFDLSLEYKVDPLEDPGNPKFMTRAERGKQIAARAKSLYFQGKYDQALTECEKALQTCGTDCDSLSLKSAIYNQLGNADQSTSAADEALTADPYNKRLYVERALDLALNHETGALKLLGKATRSTAPAWLHDLQDACDSSSATKADKAITNYWQQRGLMFLAAKNYAAAVPVLELACSRSTPEPAQIDALATAYLCTNKPAEALEILNKITAKDSNNADLLCLRGECLSKLNRQDEALAAYSKALEVAPSLGRAAKARGLISAKLGNYDQSLRDLCSAITNGADTFDTRSSRAEVYLASGHPKEALEDFERALELSPSSKELRQRRAEVYLKLGINDKAITELNSLIAAQSLPELKLLRGRARAQTADYAKAIEDFDAVINTDPTNGQAYLLRAMAKQKSNKAEEAFADLSTASKLGSTEARRIKDQIQTGISAGNSTPVWSTDADFGPNRPVRDKWALVVGISKYTDSSIPGLRYPAKDARDFYNYLVGEAHFAPDHVRLLTDEKATQRRILTELGDKFLPQVAKKDDLVVVYISSHGSPARVDVKSKNYLIAYDSEKSNLFASGIEMQQLMQLIKDRVDSERVLIVLDACHSGAADPHAKGLDDGPGNFDAAEIAQGTGKMVISSSQADERSWESARYTNGVFTRRLIDGLRKNGDNTRLAEAFNYTVQLVSSEVKESHGARQTPVLKSMWEGNDLLLAAPPRAPQVVPSVVLKNLAPDSSHSNNNTATTTTSSSASVVSKSTVAPSKESNTTRKH